MQVSPGLVVVLGVDQLWVWPEHQLDLRAWPLFVAPQRRVGAAAVRLGPRAVLRHSRPLAAWPGLRGGLTGGVRGVRGGGVVRQVRAGITVIFPAAESGVVTLLSRLLHPVVPAGRRNTFD